MNQAEPESGVGALRAPVVGPPAVPSSTGSTVLLYILIRLAVHVDHTEMQHHPMFVNLSVLTATAITQASLYCVLQGQP